jgi:glycine cleavage system H protein
MPIVNGCVLPDDLLYDVERQVWYRELGEGLVEVGVTSVAVAMAGTIVAVTPKRASRRLAAGNACAVFESGKFVGPTKVAFFAEIVRSNEGLMEQPSSAHADPYGAAWARRTKAGRLESRQAAFDPPAATSPSPISS